MAWVKLDDAMPHHPKVMAAGAQAFALDVAGICYSNKHATDGFIAAYALPAVFPGMPNAKRVAGKLVEVGRWHEVEGGWQIHDVADYQPSAAHQKEVSKKRAEAGRKGGSKSRRTAEADAQQSAKQSASDADNPGPSRPDPTPERASRKRSAPRTDRATRLPDGWKPDPEPELVAAIGEPAARREFAKFVDYWRAQPGQRARKSDWQATWRNWLRRAAENHAPGGTDPPAARVRDYDPDDREARFQALTGGEP